jgi:hypothetical protein
MVPSTYKIPMTKFGPYTPNSAAKGCHLQKPDKWAFGTCTLIKAVGANKLGSTAESEAHWGRGRAGRGAVTCRSLTVRRRHVHISQGSVSCQDGLHWH